MITVIFPTKISAAWTCVCLFVLFFALYFYFFHFNIYPETRRAKPPVMRGYCVVLQVLPNATLHDAEHKNIFYRCILSREIGFHKKIKYKKKKQTTHIQNLRKAVNRIYLIYIQRACVCVCLFVPRARCIMERLSGLAGWHVGRNDGICVEHCIRPKQKRTKHPCEWII